MADLAGQLADIFKSGLEANPSAAKSLAASLAAHTGDSGPSTKAEANYHTAHDSGKECGTCDNFDGKSKCSLVSGSVSADGVCDYWTGQSDNESPEEDKTDAPQEP